MLFREPRLEADIKAAAEPPSIELTELRSVERLLPCLLPIALRIDCLRLLRLFLSGPASLPFTADLMLSLMSVPLGLGVAPGRCVELGRVPCSESCASPPPSRRSSNLSNCCLN